MSCLFARSGCSSASFAPSTSGTMCPANQCNINVHTQRMDGGGGRNGRSQSESLYTTILDTEIPNKEALLLLNLYVCVIYIC